jgi:hypothetical protein
MILGDESDLITCDLRESEQVPVVFDVFLELVEGGNVVHDSLSRK